MGPVRGGFTDRARRPPVAAVTIADDDVALAEVAATRVTERVEQSIAARGSAIVCLTGGKTPEQLYRALADPARPWRARIDWARVQLYWGDERHVPPEHPDSNYGMAARALVKQVPIPPQNVHRMRGELPDPHAAAREYEQILPPMFDLQLLGLGADAHIASLFPGSPLVGSDPSTSRLNEVSRLVGGSDPLVGAVFAEHLNAWRITLTPRAILGSRAILMIVAGTGKAEAVYAALELPLDSARYPAQILRQAEDRVEWLLDAAAAARLPGARRA